MFCQKAKPHTTQFTERFKKGKKKRNIAKRVFHEKGGSANQARTPGGKKKQNKKWITGMGLNH